MPLKAIAAFDFDKVTTIFHSEPVCWGFGHPLQKGEKVVLNGMTAEVMRLTDDQRPLRVRFIFDKPLNHNQYLFFKWHNGKFVPFLLPGLNETVSLPAA